MNTCFTRPWVGQLARIISQNSETKHQQWFRSLPALSSRRCMGSKARQGRQRQKKEQRKQSKAGNKRKVPRRPPRNPIAAAQVKAALEEKKQFVPPALLSATASPFVYVASFAAEQNDINPLELFTESVIPPSFQQACFEYVSPKAFQHELPTFAIPEVALLGRSNVGKSSLLNALTSSHDLARISKQPGRTQQVNYFGIYDSERINNNKEDVDDEAAAGSKPNEARAFLVDLPGYGFAAAPTDVVDEWQRKTQEFLVARRQSHHMRRVFILVDARRGLANVDSYVLAWLDQCQIPYSVVLTKADRVSKPQQVKSVNQICMRYQGQQQGITMCEDEEEEDEGEEQEDEGGWQGPVVHVTSSSQGDGIRELMTSIDAEFAGYREERSNLLREAKFNEQ